MPSSALRRILWIVPAAIFVIMFVWMHFDPYNLSAQAVEDGWIENATAAGYAVGSIFFALTAWKAPNLKVRSWARVMTICWAALAFLCAGEEVSWGQRAFHEKTPEFFQKYNNEDEINLHNLSVISDNPILDEDRAQSIYMILGGLGIPLLALTKWGKVLFGRTFFPVLPWCYTSIWFGAYIYGKFYQNWFPIPHLPLLPHSGSTGPLEIREMLVALGTAFFGIHAFFWPSGVYVDSGLAPVKNKEAAIAPSQTTTLSS